MIELEADQRAVVDGAGDLTQPLDEAHRLELARRRRSVAGRCPEVAQEGQRLGLWGDRGGLLQSGDCVARAPIEGIDPRQPDQGAEVGVAHTERGGVALPGRAGITGQPRVFTCRELVEPDIDVLAFRQLSAQEVR